MALSADARESTGMSKRVLAAVLWFYGGWCLGAMLASVLGISGLLGPILGMTGAVLIAGDPRHIIWPRRTS